ncbi:MAG: TPM domain-containing protein [Bacteroidota bacterium]
MNWLAVRLAGLLLCLGCLVAGSASAADTGLVAIPPLTARVTDLTGTLNAGQKAALEQQLAAFEARKGAQVAVLILPSTQPESIEQFGIRLFDTWKVGRKGVDDGALLIVAKEDRKLRIEVGYGLEGALNDATAKRIIAEVITPYFKAGDFPGGIAAGVEAILKVVDGEALPALKAAAGGAGQSFGDIPELLFFALLFGIVVGGSILRRLLGNLLGCTVVGGITGGLGWLLVGSLSGILVGALAGVFLAIFGLDIVASGLLRGGRGGGFGGGGGGFSGGGGSGGGGGASGSW